MHDLGIVFAQQLGTIVGYLPSLLAAVLILIVGFIVAKLVAAAVRGLLRRTSLDNRLASSLGSPGINVEQGAATVVFWLIMLFVLVGVFQALDLAAVSTPPSTVSSSKSSGSCLACLGLRCSCCWPG